MKTVKRQGYVMKSYKVEMNKKTKKLLEEAKKLNYFELGFLLSEIKKEFEKRQEV